MAKAPQKQRPPRQTDMQRCSVCDAATDGTINMPGVFNAPLCGQCGSDLQPDIRAINTSEYDLRKYLLGNAQNALKSGLTSLTEADSRAVALKDESSRLQKAFAGIIANARALMKLKK